MKYYVVGGFYTKFVLAGHFLGTKDSISKNLIKEGSGCMQMVRIEVTWKEAFYHMITCELWL